MSHEGSVVSAVARLQHVADRRVHRVCGQDEEDSGEFQRIEAHWVHHVYDVRHLAGVRTHLLRHSQYVPGHCLIVIMG